jgi:hypothetical protein
MLIVRHLLHCQTCGELCSAVAVGLIKLSLRQAFDPFQIGIGRIRAIQLCQAQIRTAQIGTPQPRPDQERTTKPGITEVGSVQPCMTESTATQVRLAEVGPDEHGGIELSAAHVGFTQASASQHRMSNAISTDMKGVPGRLDVADASFAGRYHRQLKLL